MGRNRVVRPSMEKYGSISDEYEYESHNALLHDNTRHTRTLPLLIDE
jgi:hypothetical protein